MGYENEYASYEPLRRIIESPKVRALLDRLRIRKSEDLGDGQNEIRSNIIDKSDLTSDFTPDYVIAIDGSYQSTKAENGYPGAEYGYITISAVLIIEKSIHDFGKQEFIDPMKFRETEKASTIDTVIPGCNIIIDSEKSAKASMRRALFEELQNTSAFEEGETLLGTYEHLLKIKIESDNKQGVRKPRNPIEGVDEDMVYKFGQYDCPVSGDPLYSTDAMRLHELMIPWGTNGEMYGQIMQMLEKLWLIHILRSFEKKDWLMLLDRVAFVLDGPLACFSTWSWITKSIQTELIRINDLQKKLTGKDLLIFGIEKSGTFYNHFEDIDTDVDGSSDHFPNESALLLSDSYIKNNIIFSEGSKHQYGEDTYFGRKLFYKTKTGYRIVPVLAFFNDYQKDLETANPDQYPRLSDLMNILDELISSRYPNSISPLVSAHAEASIPLNLGKKIFDDIAQEIRDKSK